MIIKYKKIWIGFIIGLLFGFILGILIRIAFAIPAMYQRCEPSADCVIGEYIFDDDGYTPVTTDNYCQITITNPSDSVIVNAVNMSDKNDGWYYYTANISSPEGLYRSLICCDVGNPGEQCIDKTFIVGPSFDWLKEENIGAVSIADSGTSTTLVDDALTQADDFWNGMTLVIYAGANVGEIRQISDFDAVSDTITVGTAFSAAIDNTSKYLIRRDMNWAERVWAYTGSALDTANNAIAKVWSYATRALTTRQIGGGAEYIAGVTSSETVGQVANEADQTTTKYNVELIRGATFDFAGFADSGDTTTLVDSELDQPDDYWNDYRLRIMSGANIGEEQTVSDFDAASDTITVSSAFSGAIQNGDKYVLLHEERLVYKIWNATTRTLTSGTSIAGDIWGYSGGRTLSAFGSLAADVWNDTFAPTRRLTDETLTGGGSLATEAYIDALNNISVADVWSYADRSITDPDAVWEHALTQIGDAGSIGKLLKDNIDASVSSRSSHTAADVWSAVTRTLTSNANFNDPTSAQIAADVWAETARELTSYGNDITAQEVWDVLSSNLTTVGSIGKQLADNVDAAISTRASSLTVGLIQDSWIGATGTADSGTTATLVDNALTQADDFWNGMSIIITAGANAGELRQITDFDAASDTITVAPAFTTAVDATSEYIVRREYIGTPDDLSSSPSLFSRVKDIKTKLDQLDTLETKLDTIDGIIDSIRASQQLDYTVELSDTGEVLTGEVYRAKLTILDYESVPADASGAPTITIYDPTRDVQVSADEMTNLSTGVYEYTYTVPSGAASGLWETAVSVDLSGADPLTLNDYWEVEGSPAQVIINYMSDVIIPSISASVTISNEGNAGYEYQYEWCVVLEQDNPCGGDDDINYALAAKFIGAGEDWTTELNSTVQNNTGDLWFKVVVYFGTEASGASRVFIATSGPPPGPGGGGFPSLAPEAPVVPVVDLDTIYNKLLEIQNELGYRGTDRTVYKDLINTRYSLGALPNQLDQPLYTILSGVSSDIKSISGTQGFNLDDLYKVSQTDTTDLKYIKNKALELRAMIDVNKLLIDKVANEPVIKGWFEWGSVVLKVLVINPSDFEEKIVPLKYYLPREVEPQHIIDKGDLELDYDQEKGLWFVQRDIKLAPGASITKKIEIKNIWTISEEEIQSLRKQSAELIEPLKDTSYFAQAATLKSDTDRLLDGILRRQQEYKASPEEHIVIYRENKESLVATESNIGALKSLVAEVSGKTGALGSLFGVSTTMTWAIVIIVVVGIAVLMILLYVLLTRQRALAEHLAPGKKLKASSALRGKRGVSKARKYLFTYLLPPFGKAKVNVKQSIKIIKIILAVIVAIISLFMVITFLIPLLMEKNTIDTANNINKESESAEAPELLSESQTNKTEKISETKIEETAGAVTEQAKTEQNKLKITETGTGWLNVREKPSLNSKILRRVAVGDEFSYTKRQPGPAPGGGAGEWYKIIIEDWAETKEAGQGWIFGKYIETISSND